MKIHVEFKSGPYYYTALIVNDGFPKDFLAPDFAASSVTAGFSRLNKGARFHTTDNNCIKYYVV